MVDDSKGPLLRAIGLEKRFGAFRALGGVSLDVLEAEFVCLLGPSGCGKTTLLRVIGGLERQDAGTLHIGARDVSTAPPAERDCGFVFQSYALFPNHTVYENVAYGLVSRGRRSAEIQKRTGELLELVGLPEQRDKYPAQLSGGQQQRIALARALAPSPALLLLDEPLSALDAAVRGRLRDELRALQRQVGITTIMVTHDQEEALTLADRLFVMRDGVVEQSGTPAEIYRQPKTRFVASFVGAMNVVDGVVVADGRGRTAVGDLEVATARGPNGRSVSLGIRPEAIVLRPAPDEVNRILVRVTQSSFAGPTTRLELLPEAQGGTSLFATASFDFVVGPDASLLIALPSAALSVFEKQA